MDVTALHATDLHPCSVVRNTANDIRLGLGDYADGHGSFEDLTVHEAIARAWSGWEPLAYRIYHGNPTGLYLTMLLHNDDTWAATDVCISHAMVQNLHKSDAAMPHWYAEWQHQRPVAVYDEWDTFDATMRAHAVGPDAYDRAAPDGEGPLGLAEVIARHLARIHRWEHSYAPHCRAIDVLMTMPTTDLSPDLREGVESTRMLIGLGGVHGLAEQIEGIARDAVGHTYLPHQRPSVMHWTA